MSCDENDDYEKTCKSFCKICKVMSFSNICDKCNLLLVEINICPICYRKFTDDDVFCDDYHDNSIKISFRYIIQYISKTRYKYY